ncbi:MAG: PAS domain S-box protein, partial [Rhodospirillales bacterium]|nr:PAS domain S-box protein [Rhodospirillales bacterium]
MNEKQANRLNKTRDELLDELKKQDHLLETLSTTQDPDLNEYQGIFDFSPMPIIICDSQGKTIKPNAAFCKMLGYSSGELTGLTYKNFTHQEDLTEDNRLFAEVQSGLRNSYVFVKRYINKDKSIFWVRINLFKLLTGNDGSWHCIAIVENISHEILAKENLNAAVNDAKKANKSKTDFLATMSHELR